jgi:hypothetical protein
LTVEELISTFSPGHERGENCFDNYPQIMNGGSDKSADQANRDYDQTSIGHQNYFLAAGSIALASQRLPQLFRGPENHTPPSINLDCLSSLKISSDISSTVNGSASHTIRAGVHRSD